MKENIAPNSFNISPLPPKDKTNGGQSSIEKTVATQTRQKVDGDPEQIQRNEEAQYANPNKVMVDTGLAAVTTSKDLKNFYGIKGMDPNVVSPTVIPTQGGVRKLIQENVPLSYSQQSQIKADRELINYDIKKAGSASGIDINYAIPISATQTLVQTMEASGAIGRVSRFKDGLEMVQGLSAIENAIGELKNSGADGNDPQIQALATNYKILLGQVIAQDADSDDASAELKQAYSSYSESLTKLLYAKESDGATLRSKYDSLIKDTNVATVRSVYYDLDTKKDRGHYDTGSRNAKQDLMSNPIWVEEVSQMMQSSPAMAAIMSQESEKGYISEFERGIIKEMNNRIGPQMRTAYANAIEALGQDEADMQFQDVKDLFSIYDKISYRTVEDDLIEDVYAPSSSFQIMANMQDAGEEYSYDADVAARIKKMTPGRKAQDEAYQAVWGNIGGNSGSALVSSLGGERIQRFASKVRT